MGQDAEQMEHEKFWQTAYSILPQIQYIPIANYLEGQEFDTEAAKWEWYIKNSKYVKYYLRMLFRSVEFTGNNKDELMAAISFLHS